MSDNVPLPLFAPAGRNDLTDDFDLNEIFAEYFINEFEDPMNAYTSSMANYGGANHNPMANAAPPEAAPEPQTTAAVAPSVSLPTGGIRTTFHTGTTAAAPAQPPPAKKPKQGEDLASSMATAVPQPSAIPSGLPAPTPLGQPQFVPQDPGVMQQMLLQQQQQQQATALAATATMQAAVPTVPGHAGVPLPVGVGIRLGGIGGIAPQTARPSPAPGVPATFTNQQQQQQQLLPPSFGMWGPGIMSNGGVQEHAVAERRQRNREHAKRSRVRKKFMLESLQQEVLQLQKTNQELRMMVQEHIPGHAMQIIADCCKPNPVFDDIDLQDPEQKKKQQSLDKTDFNLMNSLASGQQCFVLSDPKLPDNPIVFASPGFYKLTGYTSKEVLGRNCRFLQGPGTDTRAIEVIRKAVATGSDATVCLMNYKADGTPFWNQFFIGALRDSDNNIVNYVGVQCEVEPEAGQASLEERVNQVLPLQNKDDADGNK